MSTKEIEEKRLKSLLRHIDAVKLNCVKLSETIRERGEPEISHRLIANSYIHDNSKFYGIEWLYLNDETKVEKPELFQAALTQHQQTNLHHPEAWVGGVHEMPRLYLAEMVCDWAARSQEFGTDLRSFFKDQATKRYGMKHQSKVYREIKGLIDMLLDTPFK